MLLIFGDGSVEASCALAYLRWEMEDGSVVCHLLAGKTRVAPKCKISIPRMELMGSLVAVRLYQKIKDSLRLEVEGVLFFTDSSPVLGMINKDSGTFLEFVGTRVSEIQTKSKVETEWFWIPGELNPADMGTRPTMIGMIPTMGIWKKAPLTRRDSRGCISPWRPGWSKRTSPLLRWRSAAKMSRRLRAQSPEW
jgi:hypothetical protein